MNRKQFVVNSLVCAANFTLFIANFLAGGSVLIAMINLGIFIKLLKKIKKFI